MSVFAVIICLFVKREYVWPHGLGVAATTFLMAFTIPPLGMDTSQLKPDEPVQKEAEDEKKKTKVATKGGNNKKKKKN